jgi:excinuclease ABC subunit A
LKKVIHIKGARINNLKNIELEIPKNKFVVVTGVSGSGKSSLVMDTLYAEGQRRYVESLSSYARQFLTRMKKPEVDFIRGISPAIAIEQRVSSGSSRSTVGSMTEISDYLRLLFARIGHTFSPVSGEEVKKHQVSDVVDFIKSLKSEQKVFLLAPFHESSKSRSLTKNFQVLLQKGFTRLHYKDELLDIETILEEKAEEKMKSDECLILIDRFVVNNSEENIKRIADSVSVAFHESGGECFLYDEKNNRLADYNNRFELDGMTFIEPEPNLFNPNNPLGACPTCEGFGRIIGISVDKVIPNKELSIYEGAIACWQGEKSSLWQQALIQNAAREDIPIHRPYNQLTKEEQEKVWKGTKVFKGIDAYFAKLEKKLYKIQNRVMIARFRGKKTCPECDGYRMRKESLCVLIGGQHIAALNRMPLDELLPFFTNLKLSTYDQEVGSRLLYEINSRTEVMNSIGLGYLSLNRHANTLSGGETQRIHLTRTLGSNLTSSIYILDEPTIGLHAADTSQIIEVVKSLRDLGNTVIVVEHDEEVMKNADYIIDMGPGAGIHGGEIVAAAPYSHFISHPNESLTAAYLSGKKEIQLPSIHRKLVHKIVLENCNTYNLKNIRVEIPLHALTIITGVSGSGKSTLMSEILQPALKEALEDYQFGRKIRNENLQGDWMLLDRMEYVSQRPIGKSSRSNPVTYVKAYDGIRKLMARQQLSKIRGYTPGTFSFNIDGGRCESCKGEGVQVVEMQFLADVHLICEECEGARFKSEVLEVRYNGKTIFDILEMSIEEAITFFKDQKDIIKRIQPLYDVGLGYMKLGQASNTLSGGEAQRIKLASFLMQESSKGHILFIFDEPTTGLHFEDIAKLLDAFYRLIENGHSIAVIEHNMDVIKCADWIIDLGPGGGKHGGQLIYQGPVAGLVKKRKSLTGKYLKGKV